MFDILLDGSSEFCKKFKKDVSNILDDICARNGLLIDKQGSLVTVDKITKLNEYQDDRIHNILVNNKLDSSLQSSISNDILQDAIKHYNNFDKLKMDKYYKTDVMYIFIPSIIYEDSLTIKIGFSADIRERHKQLENEYGCKMILIGCKLVKSEATEKLFHANLRYEYPESYINKIHHKTTKEELYRYNKQIIKRFNNIVEYNVITVDEHKRIVDEKNEKIKDQKDRLKEKDSYISLLEKTIK